MKNIAAALVKAQRERHTPEGRMEEARLLKTLRNTDQRRARMVGGSPLERLMRGVMFGCSECWYWVGAMHKLGYGMLPALGEAKAHRVAYRVFKGDIPEGMHVLHACDTRCCVNPEHLRLGTHAENMAEMAAKGRAKAVRKPGESNPMAKLTTQIVAEMRAAKAAGEKQISIARRYGVAPMTVSRAVRGESWK